GEARVPAGNRSDSSAASPKAGLARFEFREPSAIDIRYTPQTPWTAHGYAAEAGDLASIWHSHAHIARPKRSCRRQRRCVCPVVPAGEHLTKPAGVLPSRSATLCYVARPA